VEVAVQMLHVISDAGGRSLGFNQNTLPPTLPPSHSLHGQCVKGSVGPKSFTVKPRCTHSLAISSSVKGASGAAAADVSRVDVGGGGRMSLDDEVEVEDMIVRMRGGQVDGY
jgi:hypothetical protein